MSSQFRKFKRTISFYLDNLTFICLTILLFLLNFILTSFGLVKYVDILTNVWITSIFVLSYDLLLGYVGLLNFGHTIFFGVGAYVTAYMLMWTVLPYPIIVIVSVLIGVCLGFLLSYAVKRAFHGIPFTFVSLSIAMIIFFFYRKREFRLISGGEAGLMVPLPHMVKSFEWSAFFITVFLIMLILVGIAVFTRSNKSFSSKQLSLRILFLIFAVFSLFWIGNGIWALKSAIDFRRITPNLYLFSLTVLCFCYLFSRKLSDSPVGRIWLAIRENEVRAEVIGFNIFRYKSLALMISGGMAALAGAIYAPYRFVVSPETVFTPLLSIYATIYLIIGGIGTLSGAILGTAVSILLERLLIDYLGPWGIVVLGILFIGFVLGLPYGIIGSWKIKKV